MAMSESSGPTGGYGIRPANPSRKLIVTNSSAPGRTRLPRLPRPPKASKGKR